MWNKNFPPGFNIPVGKCCCDSPFVYLRHKPLCNRTTFPRFNRLCLSSPAAPVGVKSAHHPTKKDQPTKKRPPNPTTNWRWCWFRRENRNSTDPDYYSVKLDFFVATLLAPELCDGGSFLKTFTFLRQPLSGPLLLLLGVAAAGIAAAGAAVSAWIHHHISYIGNNRK